MIYGRATGTYVNAGDCSLRVHADGLVVAFNLPPTTAEEQAREALRLSGPQDPQIRIYREEQQTTISLVYPPGLPGDRLTAGLEGPVGEGGAPVALRFFMERVETPRIQATWRPASGEEWRPFERSRTVPAGPVQIRLTLPGGIDQGELKSRIRGATAGAPYTVEAPNLETMIINLPEPRIHHLFRFDQIPTADQLVTRSSLLEFYMGEPARLVLLDPATGAEQPLGEVPPNIQEVQVDPYGDLVALWAMGDDLNTTDLWIMNQQSGEMLRVYIPSPFMGGNSYWTERGLAVPYYEEVYTFLRESRKTERRPSQGVLWSAISPDERYLAGFAIDYKREDERRLAPATVVLHDLHSGEENVWADLVNVRVPHTEAPPHLSMLFEQEGQGLLIYEPLSGLPTAGGGYPPYRWVRLDLITGTLNETTLPDQQPAPEWRAGPQGRFAYRWNPSWGPVVLRTATGDQIQMGAGLIVGWRPDGQLLLVRWPNYTHRRGPEGP